MLDQRDNLRHSASEILGDLTALAEQLGGADGLGQFALAPASWTPLPPANFSELERFLESYRVELLFPVELPSIVRAHQHALRGQVRELTALDKELWLRPGLENFASASARVGQRQLRRLRPLRGERIVERYSQAVEQGQARAWHMIVYGVVLAIYSLPLRQGLIHFAHQTLGGFVQAVVHGPGMDESRCQRLREAQAGPISAAVERAIAQHAQAAVSPGELPERLQ